MATRAVPRNQRSYRCGKVGHISPNCFEDEANAHKRPPNWKLVSQTGGSETAAAALDNGNKVEFLLCGMCFTNNAELLNNPNIWIADTAATVHSTPHNVGFKNTKEASKMDTVTMGNGADVGATTIAQLPGVICDKNGCELQEATLDDVTHLPGAKFNLFSLSRMTRHGGWKLRGDKDAIWIEKDNKQIRFDIIIPTPKGALYCMYYKRASEMAMAVTDQGTKMSIMKAHDLLGHCSEEITRTAAKAMGWILSGPWRPCESCAAGKAKQKNVPKRANTKRQQKEKTASSSTLQLSRSQRTARM
jgi:hypothetical protein